MNQATWYESVDLQWGQTCWLEANLAVLGFNEDHSCHNGWCFSGWWVTVMGVGKSLRLRLDEQVSVVGRWWDWHCTSVVSVLAVYVPVIVMNLHSCWYTSCLCWFLVLLLRRREGENGVLWGDFESPSYQKSNLGLVIFCRRLQRHLNHPVLDKSAVKCGAHRGGLWWMV
jgi:hypothetical protein